MKVIGIKESNFKGSDGKEVTGYNVYLATPIAKDKGEGLQAERVYMTTARMATCGYMPKVDDEVKVEYNRYGKVDALYPVE